MARKTSSHPILLWSLPRLIAGYVHTIWHILRWQIEGQDIIKDINTNAKPFIAVAWHSRLLMWPVLKRFYKGKVVMLISPHRDGEMIDQVMKRFDLESVRGSSADPRKPHKNKRGAEALRGLAKALKRGHSVALTPDGPRGPNQKAQAGVAQLARLTGLPVVPIAYSVRYAKIFDSWDRFLLPLPVPFSKGVMVIGTPIEALIDEDHELIRQRIEDALNIVTSQADLQAGRIKQGCETETGIEKVNTP